MTTTTFDAVLARAGVTCPDDTLSDIEVPVLTVPQRQGDVAIIPFSFVDRDGQRHTIRGPLGRAEIETMTAVPSTGVAVVRGEATGNTHLLMPEVDCEVLWAPATPVGGDVSLGVLHVPDGATAWLIHTDEHGVNGIGPGSYLVHGKREQADEIRRVAD